MSAHHRRRYPNLWERIRANVTFAPPPTWAGVHGDCWIWARRLNARGYAFIGIWDTSRGWSRSWLVHRVVLHLFHGIPWHEIPVGAHLCGVKNCVSPFHLDAQTPEQNRAHYRDVEKPARLAMAAGGGSMREPGED